MAMNVSLTPELEAFVDDKVKSGLYNSASELVRASLRMFKHQDELEQLQLEELRLEIKGTIDELEAGKGIPIEAVCKRLAQRRAKKR